MVRSIGWSAGAVTVPFLVDLLIKRTDRALSGAKKQKTKAVDAELRKTCPHEPSATCG
jgi:hypothetical protein